MLTNVVEQLKNAKNQRCILLAGEVVTECDRDRSRKHRKRFDQRIKA